MNPLLFSLPMGRIGGIHVRVHITLILFAAYKLQEGSETIWSIFVYLLGLYICILLHEFGHALAARWCDGDCDEVLLWPLGGLAYARTPADPTAHLITAAAGPAVSLALWMLFAAWGHLLGGYVSAEGTLVLDQAYVFCVQMASLNTIIFFFNLLPAYPMDGGRILRALLCYFLPFESSARITAVLGMLIAILFVGYGLVYDELLLAIIGLFVFSQSQISWKAPGLEGTAGRFSIKERLQRMRRKSQFSESLAIAAAQTLHRCHSCGCTEASSPELDFRVAADGEEYCSEHLPEKT
jgi:Zn-dependent protease